MDGETLAACENTTPEQTQSLIDNINGITHADSIGGIESLTIQDINTSLNLVAIDSIFLATLSSREGDQKIIKSLTRVVAPAVVRLTLEKTQTEQKKKKQAPKDKPAKKKSIVLNPEFKPQIKPLPEPEAPPEPLLPKAPTSQFMVERVGGILVPSDTVRIDWEVVIKWREFYGKDISMVSVETLEGRIAKCRFRTKSTAKGIIQIPDKILRSLQTGKGKLVMVKPVID